MNLLKSLFPFFLISLVFSCTKVKDFDCKGRTDFPTTPQIDSNKALLIARKICDCLNEQDVPAIQITIIDSFENSWTLTTGTADRKRNIPVEDHNQFRLASITKTFIAVLTFQLIEEGKLTPETSVSQFFPDFENAEQINISHLLNHSSGLKDLLTLPDILMTSTSNTTKIWDPYSIAETVLDKKLKFTPGTDNQYSNSNYLLLGLIAKEVSNTELNELLQEKLFNPAGFTGFTFHPEVSASGDLISGYDRKFIPIPGLYELTRENTSFASAAYASGNLIANSVESALFFHALFNEQIISSYSLTQMKTFAQPKNPDNEYLANFGNGLFQYELNGKTYIGHEGQFIGFDNVMVHQPESNMTIVLLANVSTYEKFGLLKEILSVL